MEIRLAFCTHLFFSRHFKPIGYGFVFCWLLCTSCHKEDTGAYMVTSEDFYEVAVPEHNYQELLNVELLKVTADPRFPALAKKRVELLKKYILELNLLLGITGSDYSIAISDQNRERLLELKKLTGDSFKKELVRLTVESDQQLIGFHVNAISSEGAKDPALREWARQKLPVLTGNLSEVQALH
ncbi:DUF4142 domain-containing protein [Pedobacter alluvionis]|uniref:DUF4142 domain-containing protein n=1 Tax=Pedobacter alluvionis TaxID=475253 RepID=A0A497Y210_9SPHI|nr:DUF4142 domain-containing protein [Pedobacter alluvionis]RLJ76802.1 uncharacterized protein DUF4142 [Pedobacter alluvionis]TFB33932.1 DUF4142 domain-containing protein [Pedobacter alluvionis]